MQKSHLFLAAALAASLVFNFVQLREIRHRDLRKTYDMFSERYVDRAVILYAKETKQSPSHVLQHNYPVAVVTEKGTCVNLRLPSNAIGWMPVYCFDKQGRLTYKTKV